MPLLRSSKNVPPVVPAPLGATEDGGGGGAIASPLARAALHLQFSSDDEDAAANGGAAQEFRQFEKSRDNLSAVGDLEHHDSDEEIARMVKEAEGREMGRSTRAFQKDGNLKHRGSVYFPDSPSKDDNQTDTEPSSVLKRFGAMLSKDNVEVIRDGGLSSLGSSVAKAAVVATQLIYLSGMACIVIYAFIVRFHSPTLGAMHTVIPAILHVVGVGSTVILKVYYDFSRTSLLPTYQVEKGQELIKFARNDD